MNVIFLTQNKTLSLFYNIVKMCGNDYNLKKIGFYLADSEYYQYFKKDYPDINTPAYEKLAEWDIVNKALNKKPDIRNLKDFEKKIGDPYLWNAIIADRRIYLGREANYKQDYASRFNHEQMLSILQIVIEEMEKFFNDVKPDLIISFICVTIGEYIAHLIAKLRNIPIINLRPTRIKNYIYGGEDIFEPSRNLERAYKCFLQSPMEDKLDKDVTQYINKVRNEHAMYEGVLPPQKFSGHKVSGSSLISKMNKLPYKAVKSIKKICLYNFGQYKHDNHYNGTIRPIIFSKLLKPLKVKYIDFRLRKKYITSDSLGNTDYAFYPLHKEPEVTLLVYSRPYLNQIEVIRSLARSLPVGMKLIVKEHPVSIGYRPLSYYKKIISIPNVILSSPSMTSRDLVNHAKLICIISGSIGLEALLMKKPVIVLGNAPFNFLPETMIKKVNNIEFLSNFIHVLLNYTLQIKKLAQYLFSKKGSSNLEKCAIN